MSSSSRKDSELQALFTKLQKIDNELAKVRGVEYDLPFGSARRAKVSRKWDMLAQEKMQIMAKIDGLNGAAGA